MKQKKKMLYIAAYTTIILIMAITFVGWRYYVNLVHGKETIQQNSKTSYRHHYALIPEDADSGLWQDIYRSAKETAEQHNAYVEQFADWAAGDYDPLEYMEIAIAARVDGIIIKPDGTKEMCTMIQNAEAAGIPVITILDDDTDSERKSFVGINSYQLGTTYGRQILECMQEDTKKITILMKQNESGNDLIFKELKATVQEGLSEEQKEHVDIQPLTISSTSTFEAEEVIRDLVNSRENRPDIVVCMSEIDSVSAYHATVDYNLVGDISIIGYYQSDTMLDAIEKGTVPMVITLNTQQIGARCIEALEEYHEMGHVSSYYSVDLSIITESNVDQFRTGTK